MVKTALSGTKRSWKIHCQKYWLPGVFVVPVNPRRIDDISTDTRICYFVMLSFLVVIREKQILLILFLREPPSFNIVNVAVINKGQIKKTCNFIGKT